jgi:hypothetical protein
VTQHFQLYICKSPSSLDIRRSLSFHILIFSSTLAADIIDGLSDLNTSQLFCSKAPEITNLPRNITVLATSDTTLICDAIGDPIPQNKWYQNDVIGAKQQSLTHSLTHSLTDRNCKLFNAISTERYILQSFSIY